MSLPGSSPSRLGANFNPIHANILEQQNANQQGNNNALQNPGNEFILATVSPTVNLPGFWLEKPSTWFNMCESAFAVHQITSSITKYHHCVGKLPTETVATVEDVVNNHMAFTDPYTELKQ